MKSAADVRLVVLCCHGIQDPLVSTLMLDYLFRMQQRAPGRKALLITEEPDVPPVLSPALEGRLRAAGITWSPLHYRVEGRQFLQKGRNLLLLWWRAWRFARKGRRRVVIGFLSMAGAYAALLRCLGFIRCICVNFEPHSAYMVDAGLWSERSFKYRFVAWSERFQVRRADVLIAPSSAVLQYAQGIGTLAQLHLQGVTIDVAAARRDDAAGLRYRAQWGIEAGSIVLLYVGKFNGLYYSEADYVRFMCAASAADPRVRHVLITFPEHISALRSAPGFEQVDRCTTLCGPMAPEVLHEALSAGDIGVIAVPPTPSQVFRSPVKTALYWAAGLPVLICRGVSDDWWVAEERGTGAVVGDLPSASVQELKEALAGLNDGAGAIGMRERCVRAAMELRDTSLMVDLLERVLEAERT